jgi:phosphoribosylamine--glycine ligase
MTDQNLKILVIGSGGREHTIAKECAQSPRVDQVMVTPGNGGINREFVSFDSGC